MLGVDVRHISIRKCWLAGALLHRRLQAAVMPLMQQAVAMCAQIEMPLLLAKLKVRSTSGTGAGAGEALVARDQALLALTPLYSRPEKC